MTRIRANTLCLTVLSAILLSAQPYAEEHPMSSPQQQPALQHRGLMIDMIRLKERDAYYFQLLEQLDMFGYNALYLHFTDNEGCAIELENSPELVTAHAMDQATLQRLLHDAAARGIDVIPEVEAWGHAQWILRRYPELADPANPRETLLIGHEQVYELLDRVIGEVAALFPGEYIHIGFDEAWRHDKQPDLSAEEMNALVAQHANRVSQIVASYNKTPVFWADMLLHRPAVLADITDDARMINWDYLKYYNGRGAQALHEAGYPVLTGPALVWAHSRLHPGPYNFENIRRAARTARDLNLEGMVTTIWLPQRYIPGVLPHGIAYAGRLGLNPDDDDLHAAMQDFVARYFQTTEPAIVDAFVRLCNVPCEWVWLDAAFWRDEGRFHARLKPESRSADAAYRIAVSGIRETFREHAATVQANETDYQAYILLGELLEYLADRRLLPAAIQQTAETARAEIAKNSRGLAVDLLEGARADIASLQQRRLSLLERLKAHYNHYRYPDTGLAYTLSNSNLIWWMESEETTTFCDETLPAALNRLIADVGQGATETWPLPFPGE